jgi:MFS family permease
MIGATAMTFTAILYLHATPGQMGVLNSARVVPSLLVSLLVGAWVDRVRRRSLMIWADLGRALLLSSIPLVALIGALTFEQMFIVTLAVSILTVIFDVAYQSYLPTLIGKQYLQEGNSKLSASAAVAEFSGFSIAGWLVQALTAPIAILVDAGSFLVSAQTIWLIRASEPVILPQERRDLRREIGEGLRFLWSVPGLRASAMATTIHGLGSGVFGALVVLYMSRELGFSPGVLGIIWAVGGASSFFGAALVPRINRRLGLGPAMIVGLGVFGVSQLLIPLASGATLVSALFLVAQQLGDGFYVVYGINQVSLRQEIAPEHILGRVIAPIQFLYLGSTLVGSIGGGWMAEMLGVRLVLVSGGCASLVAALTLGLSPLRKYKGRCVGSSETPSDGIQLSPCPAHTNPRIAHPD